MVKIVSDTKSEALSFGYMLDSQVIHPRDQFHQNCWGRDPGISIDYSPTPRISCSVNKRTLAQNKCFSYLILVTKYKVTVHFY